MNDTLTLNVKGNSYTIKFPTVGEFRQIESLKQVLSNGMYNQLATTTTTQAQHAADMIDIEATLTVLAPDLIKDLKCTNFSDLGIKDYTELRNIYVNDFLPWWNELLKEIGLND